MTDKTLHLWSLLISIDLLQRQIRRSGGGGSLGGMRF